jgi:sugar phosphate isomerase/epimerase
LHLGVGNGTVDWSRFADDIRKAKYEGTVMVESCSHIEESVEALRKLLR